MKYIAKITYEDDDIDEAFERLGVSYRQLAKWTGIDHAYLQRIFTGKKAVSEKMRARLWKFFLSHPKTASQNNHYRTKKSEH